ncbi:hypothetical protein [Paenibacillus luteus]|nr:hypothetical protein [Paenibacillus luteus]
MNKVTKVVLWTVVIVVVTVFVLLCLFGIIFFSGVWFRDVFMQK